MDQLTPAVFCVGHEYQIMSPAVAPSLFTVRVGDKDYYDEYNGLLRSDSPVHKVTVPMEELDRQGAYTVIETPMFVRSREFPVTGETVTKVYPFYPLKEGAEFKAFFISDAHENSTGTVAAAKAFGDFDLLILGGDAANSCDNVDGLMTIYRIADALTHGNKPIVCIRGNHTLRGKLAENLGDYIPTDNGKTYYTFKTGSVWGVVLDCGEDKVDEHIEYGGTVCCHGFRNRETEFLRKVCAEKEYNASDVKTRLVLCHVPFTHIQEEPFDIEQDTYRLWCELLKTNVHPTLTINGHLHRVVYSPVGGEMDDLGQPSPVVIGSIPGANYVGTGFVFGDGKTEITFIRSDGTILEHFTV